MKLLEPIQTSQMLGVSVKTVHKLCRTGVLKCVQITFKIRRFTVEQVEEFIEARSTKGMDTSQDESELAPKTAPEIQVETEEINVNRNDLDLTQLRKEMKQW